MALVNLSGSPVSQQGNAASEQRVLLVEDRGPLRDALVRALQVEGFDTRATSKAKETLHQVRSWQPDLLLIDLVVNNQGGLAICRHVSGLVAIPIIVLAAVDAESEVLEALKAGAIDYATRPLDGRALMTRVRTTLARCAQHGEADADQSADQLVEVGPLRIERARRRVFVRGKDVHFAKMEYNVLLALALRPGEIRTRKDLFDEIWAGRRFEDPRTLDVHIRRIREKLELDPGHPEHLVTVRGIGFYFKADGL